MSEARAPDFLRATSQAILTIDLAALTQNWRKLAARVESAECAAVVKADAYGLGLAPVAQALLAAGCRSFFVAHLAEGEALRRIAQEARGEAARSEAARIFVLNGLAPGASPLYAQSGLIPVLGSLPEITEWSGFCCESGVRHPAAIHIDTGMNRLGLSPQDYPVAIDLLRDFTPALIMSHFVSAEDASAPRNRRQIERFHEACEAFPPIPASLCNSSGLFLEEAPTLDLVRPGYALYGGNPTPGSENPMRRVVSLEASVIQVREIPGGETAGYNARWTAPGRRKLATISIGYADGLPRSASCGTIGADVYVGGRYCPIVGRVSMDLSIIDVSETAPVRRGDRVEVLGPHVTVDDLGTEAGTIGYEVLTNLGRRYRRVYINGGA